MTDDAAGDGVGAALGRREDRRLLTGAATYTADLVPATAVHAVIVRSEYGHAHIDGIDTSDAAARDGVIGVFTGTDLARDIGTPSIPIMAPVPTEGPHRSITGEPRIPHRPIMATETTRYTGEPVAVVVAEDAETAADAATSIAPAYDRLDAVTELGSARDRSAPTIHDEAPENVAFEWSVGEATAVEAAFAQAAHTVTVDLTIPRLVASPMEPRGALARFEPSTERLTVTMPTQIPHVHRDLVAEMLGLPADQVHVRAPEIGGGFGVKSKHHPAELITAWVATQVDRPVFWQATRSEAFRADVQGRGHETSAALGLDADGTITGLRVDTAVDVGAYVSRVAPTIATSAYAEILSEQYAIPAIHARTIATFTNAAPLDAYRGAGRPEAAYVVERLVARAAAYLGIDPAEVRRRNFIDADAFPYETALGLVYDSGDYATTLERALALADYSTVRTRQTRLRREGRYLGVGIGCFVESAGIDAPEGCRLRFEPDGSLTAFCGTSDTGQGHRTTFAQVLADRLGLPTAAITVHEGDTEALDAGVGTFGSRSAMAGSATLLEAAAGLREQARRFAAEVFGVPRSTVSVEGGSVRGNDGEERPLSALASATYEGTTPLPDSVERGFESEAFISAPTTYPAGAHVAVVEVDPNTGEIDLERYVAVDDCGVRINPTLVEGQVHGGIVQGIGEALYEAAEYDGTGTLRTGSFQDYAIPSATQVPALETGSVETPAPTHPLGVKGVGEGATMGPPAAIANAVIDALEPLGVSHVDLPLVPESVWQAVVDADGETGLVARQ